MNEEIVFNLMKLYYENIEIFKNKLMSLEDLINEYKTFFDKNNKNV